MWAPALDLTTTSTIFAALLAAILGSAHCLVMCGPLRLLSGEGHKARVLYQGGRAGAYAALGAGAGAIGKALPLGALLAFLVVATALALLPLLPRWRIPGAAAVRRIAAHHPFLLGASSGLLPCGLLHGWLVAATAMASPARGALLLGALWLGTVPALELAPLALKGPLARLRMRFPRAILISAILLSACPALWRASLAVAASGPVRSCHHQAEPVLSGR